MNTEKITFILLGLISFFGIIFLYRLLRHIYYGYGVPYVPTSDIKIEKLTEILEMKPGEKFLDIGCGDGRILELIKNKFPNNEVTGIENSPDPYRKALKRNKVNKLDYRIIKGDFFQEDWSEYDVIHCYLISYLMPRIWKKFQSECRSGAKLYSSAFEVPGIESEKIKIEKGNYKSCYYIYTL